MGLYMAVVSESTLISFGLQLIFQCGIHWLLLGSQREVNLYEVQAGGAAGSEQPTSKWAANVKI